MAVLKEIRLPGLTIPVLHEDRAMMAIDKPAGWMLAPEHADRVINNLHALLMGSIIAGDTWARSRGIRFLRYVHRLDADTTGVLILAKSKGAIGPLSQCFARHEVEKVYLAVIRGEPRRKSWVCDLPLGPPVRGTGRVTVSRSTGKPAETEFQVIATSDGHSLVACRPLTGRTHQIRVHLLETAGPIVGDRIYGGEKDRDAAMALRAVYLRLRHPFLRKPVAVTAPSAKFLRRFGFDPAVVDFDPAGMTGSRRRSAQPDFDNGSEEKEESGHDRRSGIQGPSQGRPRQRRRR
ncbi:MAG: RluA family pseudouridine synthase [Verrucomicrobiae bacterium]|nr:RluA family pseudouridine synthase [Verrucomicrobiae bacterium]